MERVLGGISAVGGNKVGKKVAKNLANADKALKAIGRQLGGSMLSEFREEYLQEVLDTVFRNIMLKTDEEVELFSPEAFYSGILGALTGGFAEGPAAVSNGVKTGSTLAAGKTAGVYFDYGGGNVVAFSDAHKGGLSKTQATGVRAAALLHKLGIGGDVYFFESYRNKEGELVCRDAAGKEVAAPNGWYSQKDGSAHIDCPVHQYRGFALCFGEFEGVYCGGRRPYMHHRNRAANCSLSGCFDGVCRGGDSPPAAATCCHCAENRCEYVTFMCRAGNARPDNTHDTLCDKLKFARQ